MKAGSITLFVSLVVVGLSLSALATPPRYTINAGDGEATVLDNLTSFEWAQTQSDTPGVTWAQALAFCEALEWGSNTDWRVPDVLELASLVDETAGAPAINTTYFVGFHSDVYWTSTTYPSTPSYAYAVFFDDYDSVLGKGGVGTHDKTSTARVMCVRDGSRL